MPVSEKRHEWYLIALALVILAGVLVVSAFEQEPLAAPAAALHTLTQQAQPAETEGSVGETQTAAPATQKPPQATKNQLTGPVNINTAPLTQLVLLPGIGEVKAQAIVDYREQNGPFQSTEELLEVKGIGEATYAKLEALVTV